MAYGDSDSSIELDTGKAQRVKSPGSGMEEESADSFKAVATFPKELGYCLSSDKEKKIAKKLFKRWESQNDFMAERLTRWKANVLRRRGVPGVAVIRKERDRNVFEVWTPPTGARVSPTFNKANRACRRLKANLFVDRHLPECVPMEAADKDDPDAAEFQTRILTDLCGPAKLDTHTVAQNAFNRASSYASGFVLVEGDPEGGPQRPRSIIASPVAKTVGEAEFRTIMVPRPAVDEMGQPVLDEMGQPVTEEEQVQLPQPGPFVTRYIKAIGAEQEGGEEIDDLMRELTDDPLEAEYETMPVINTPIYDGRHVRMWPTGCDGIEDATQVMLLTLETLGDLKASVPRVAAMTPEELRKMANYRPSSVKDILPMWKNSARSPGEEDDDEGDGEGEGDEKKLSDDTDVLVLRWWCLHTHDYPEGAYVMVAGEDFVLERDTRRADLPTGKIIRPLPFSQHRQFTDWSEDGYGEGLMDVLGSGNEIRASIVSSAIDNLWKINNAKVFYSPDSMFQPKSSLINQQYVAVENGSKPETEKIPEFPRIGMELFNTSTVEMDDEVGLPPAAQGQVEPSITSGLQLQRTLEQVHVQLSDVKWNQDRAILRLWKLITLEAAIGFDKPQRLRPLGDDNLHKEEEWMGSDLMADADVQVQKGTGTMLAPSARMAVAEYAMDKGLMNQAQLLRTWGGSIGGLLNAQDNPHQLRIERQNKQFLKGPGDAPEANWPEVAAQIYNRLPNDLDIEIATLRFEELNFMLSSTKFSRLPAGWQVFATTEYNAMRLAAGRYTLAEQQMQAQAAAASQAQSNPPPQAGKTKKMDPENKGGSGLVAEQAEPGRPATPPNSQLVS